jgi:hypothetical protein
MSGLLADAARVATTSRTQAAVVVAVVGWVHGRRSAVALSVVAQIVLRPLGAVTPDCQ